MLMRRAYLVGVGRRRGVRTTQRFPEEMSAPDLVQQDFTATVCEPGLHRGACQG